MAAGRFRRFLNIERPRAPGADPGPDLAAEDAGRFQAVEGPGTVPDGSRGAGAHLDRFRPALERAPELATAADELLPFIRCAACGADSNRFAARCERCGAGFETAAQRAFDERFRAERRGEAERERAAAAEFQAGRAHAAEEDSRARRHLGEALAERERERFDETFQDPTPFGLRLLRLIPDPRWRAAVAVAALVTVLGIAVHGLASGRPGPSLAVAVGLALVLLSPRTRWW
jgi:hypothetical protein